jgi:hypothetical protein
VGRTQSHVLLSGAESEQPIPPASMTDDGEIQCARLTRIGHSSIEYSQASGILSKGLPASFIIDTRLILPISPILPKP